MLQAEDSERFVHVPRVSMKTHPPRLSSRENRVAPARWLRWLAIALGLALAAALIYRWAWAELHPAALLEAEAAYRRDDVRGALRAALGHLARRPRSQAAALIAARCFSRLDRADQAEPHWQKAGALAPEDRHIRAFALVTANRREAAIQAYREILARRPDDVLAWRRLAAVLISERRWPEAVEAADRLSGIPDGAVIGHTLAAVVHHDTYNPEQSVNEFGRVLELDPDLKRMPLSPRSMFWSYYALDLYTNGRLDDAQRILDRALREQGDNAELADLLGRTYYTQGKLDDAEHWWRRALDTDPNRGDTWWRLGRLALQRGKADEAVEPLLRAIELEPNAVGPVYGLSLAYRRLGRIAESDDLRARVDRLRARPPSAQAKADASLGPPP